MKDEAPRKRWDLCQFKVREDSREEAFTKVETDPLFCVLLWRGNKKYTCNQ